MPASAPLHLVKLAVGVTDPAHLARLQAARAAADPPLRHLTRHLPRRAAEITAAGSIYWVIGGLLLVRQRIFAIRPVTRADGTPAAALELDPALHPLAPRAMAPFQGWRYLAAADAPPDLDPRAAAPDALPATLAAELRRLGLL